MSIRRPNLVWMRGPLPAGEMHDGTMYRGGTKRTPMKDRDRNALYFMVPKEKKAIGDSGYSGIYNVTITREGQSRELKLWLVAWKNKE